MLLENVNPNAAKRGAWRSIRRGLAGRCPNCGEGRLFRGYLTAVAACAVCGENLSHERSDDFAPYLTMVAVGHVVVPALLVIELGAVLPTLSVLAVALPATALVAGALLRPIKGAIICLQWALRMHGFADANAACEAISGHRMDSSTQGATAGFEANPARLLIPDGDDTGRDLL